MFYITHENGITLAARAPEGEMMSPRYSTDNISDACDFDTWSAASEVNQNFGPEWTVEEIG